MSKRQGDVVIQEAKQKLGREITKCRGTTSQRKLAGAVGLPPSNMKYIEDGINAPSFDVYTRLITTLQPDSKQRKKMDRLYSLIRKTPPPDVCNVITSNQELNEVMRILEGHVLTPTQIDEMKEFVSTIKQENVKGASDNG